MTLARARAYATLIALTLWSVWAVDFSVAGPLDRLGKVKATDFLHFYVIGSLVHEGRWQDLYDARAQHALARAVAPASDETFFVPIESPQVAALYAPLAAYSYTIAVMVWLAGTVLLYAVCCLATWRLCPRLHGHGYFVATSCAAFPGLYSLVLHGQTSALSLGCIVAALLALQYGHQFVAGLALGCLVFKPQWLVAAGAVFFLAREWRLLAGALASAIGQLALTDLYVGSSVMGAYWEAIRSLPRIANLLEPKASDSLKGLFSVFVPLQSSALVMYAVAAFAIGLIAARIWRSTAPLDVRFSAAVIALVLVNPHVSAYDLVVLAPVYLLLVNWLADPSNLVGSSMHDLQALRVCLGLSILAPLLGGAPALIRLQFSVTSLAAVLVLLWRIADANPYLNHLNRATGFEKSSVHTTCFSRAGTSRHRAS